MMIKKYFSFVPLWLGITVSALTGAAAVLPFAIAMISINGLMGAEPEMGEQIFGCFILVMIVVTMFLIHLVTYLLCRKRALKRSLPEREISARNAVLYTAAVIAAALITFILAFSIVI